MLDQRPSPELLRKLLRYEPDTGKLFWLERTSDMFAHCTRDSWQSCDAWNSRNANRETFTSCDKNGYRRGRIYRRYYFAHRVIWAMVHDRYPAADTDHINGVQNDNRLVNIRAVTHQENLMNCRIRSDNKSGCTGVVWNKAGNVWHSRIKFDGKFIHLGSFSNKADAVGCRRSAEAKYGFHPNHGRES